MIILRYRQPKLLHSDISKLPLTYLFLSGFFIKLHPCSSLWGEKQSSTSLKTTDIFHLDNSVLSILKKSRFYRYFLRRAEITCIQWGMVSIHQQQKKYCVRCWHSHKNSGPWVLCLQNGPTPPKKNMCAWLCRQTAKRAKAWQKLNIKDSDHLSSFCYPVKYTLGFYTRSATCENMKVTVEIFVFILSHLLTCDNFCTHDKWAWIGESC